MRLHIGVKRESCNVVLIPTSILEFLVYLNELDQVVIVVKYRQIIIAVGEEGDV